MLSMTKKKETFYFQSVPFSPQVLFGSLSEQNVNELNQWLSAIRKVSIYNEGMLPSFHPGAHRSGKWTCCLQGDRAGNPAFIIHSFLILACFSTRGVMVVQRPVFFCCLWDTAGLHPGQDTTSLGCCSLFFDYFL